MYPNLQLLETESPLKDLEPTIVDLQLLLLRREPTLLDSEPPMDWELLFLKSHPQISTRKHDGWIQSQN